MKAQARRAARSVAVEVLAARDRWQGRTSSGMSASAGRAALPARSPPDEEQSFRELVASLARDHQFIGYSEAMRRVREGDIDRPYLSFSFDDGFASNVRAARILEEFGATGMFFVPTGFVGTRTVAEARAFYGFDYGCDEPAMTWDDLEALKASGHEIGNHTNGHRILSSLGAQEQHDEIGTAAEILRSRLGASDHFAWPYGRFVDFTPEAARAVFETGHATCASAVRGAHLAGPPIGGASPAVPAARPPDDPLAAATDALLRRPQRPHRRPGHERLARGLGRAMSRLPDLIVIGAQKCGTTTLWEDLRGHPRVHLGEKESRVLSGGPLDRAELVSRYARQFRGAKEGAVLGEVSTRYAMLPDDPDAPANARSVAPRAQIVYIVRDPLDRVVSHHHHDFGLGFVGPDIDEAVESYPSLLGQHPVRHPGDPVAGGLRPRGRARGEVRGVRGRPERRVQRPAEAGGDRGALRPGRRGAQRGRHQAHRERGLGAGHPEPRLPHGAAVAG